MAHKNFEKMDNTENVEKVEQGEKTEGKEKESILSKVKNFFAENGKGKEGKEDTESKKEDGSDAKEKMDEKRNSFEERLKVGGPDQKSQSEFAKEYREKHGLDEHGNNPDAKRPEGGYEKEKGEDGPRSRWDTQQENGKENKEKETDNQDNKTDDE